MHKSSLYGGYKNKDKKVHIPVKRQNVWIEVSIEGIEKIHVEHVTVSLEDNVEVSRKVKTKDFFLKEITVQQLFNLRMSGKPGCVVKVYGKYYYTPIPRNLRLVSQPTLWTHMCGKKSSECKRLSAASDQNGGCAKVRDLTQEVYMREGATPKEALELSKRIEKYDFIEMGIESFNTLQDSFIVAECTHYAKCERTEEKKINLYATKQALVQYIWPELTKEEIRVKLEVLGNKYKYLDKK